MNDYTDAPHRSKKNTKRWCKGKVGREHDVDVRVPTYYGSLLYWADVCRNCGKMMDYHFQPE